MVSAASHSSPGISFVPGNVMRHSSQPFNQFPAPDLSSTLHQTISDGLSPVLMIDDDREFCALIRDYLEPFGYAVSAAHTGPAGVEKASAQQWLAVILDVMLPGMDGFDVL